MPLQSLFFAYLKIKVLFKALFSRDSLKALHQEQGFYLFLSIKKNEIKKMNKMHTPQTIYRFEKQLNIKVAGTTRQKKRMKSKAFSSYTRTKKK